jgi:iron complex outermembrane recepter protein
MRKMLSNQVKGRVSLLSVIAVMTMFPTAAIAEEAAAEDGEQGRSRRADEIVVTARSLSSPDMPAATPLRILSGEELVHRRQGGLGETLTGLPGVHLDNFGGGASRPVIRGQTVPRIEILTDGANLFDVSSVSPDHAITTDPLLLDGIEILRGPAATRYGGNAMNGAINLIDGKVPKALPAGRLSGATEVRFGTGEEERTIVGRVTAGLGPFAIHAEGSRRRSENYEVPDSFGSDKLKDSFADNSSYNFGASWITSKGYLGAAYTRQDSDYGLPGHSHANNVCHLHAPNLHCEAHGSIVDIFAELDDGDTAQIELRSERIDVRADYQDLLPGFERTRLRMSYTDYQHAEIDAGTVFSRYGNKVYDARLELTHKRLLGFTGTLGVQYTDGTFSGLDYNNAHIGKSSNKFHTENLGIFLDEGRNFGAIDLQFGVRYDWRSVTPTYPSFNDVFGDALGIVAQLMPDQIDFFRQLYMQLYTDSYITRKSRHNLLSLSGSVKWSMGGGFSTALSLARSERAPSVRELYAGGNNLATNSFEVGLSRTTLLGTGFPANPMDIKETARSVNLTFRKEGGSFEFEVGLFYQDIDNYIFARFLEEQRETGLPQLLLLYTAADATFAGVDGQVSYRLAPESHVTVFGDYIHADLKSKNDNLPRIPPGRLGARYEGSWGAFSTDLEYYRTFAQNRFAFYETRTGGYSMVNATLAYRFDVGNDKAVEFYARGTNLTNELALSHTSFVKNQSPLRGRSIAFGMRHQF